MKSLNRWSRILLSWTMAFVLLTSAIAQKPDTQLPPASPLAGIEVGTRVKLHLNDRRTLEGVLESRTAQDVSLRTKRAGTVHVPLNEISSVERGAKEHTGGAVKWIVLGVVLGAAAIISYVFLVELHNEGAI